MGSWVPETKAARLPEPEPTMKTFSKRSSLVPPAVPTLVMAIAVALGSLACGPELAGDLDLAAQQQGLAGQKPKFQRSDRPVPGSYLITLRQDAAGDIPGLAQAL